MTIRRRRSSFPRRRRFTLGLWVGLLLLAGVAWAAGQAMSVQVRTTKLRARPSFLGSTISDVDYGTKVTVESRRGPWVQVALAGGRSGWIHESALSEKKLAMSSGQTTANTGASGEEIALAGKGFSDEVEQEYRNQHSEQDYTWVDFMETIVISPEQAEQFLAAGQVKPAEGGH